MDAIIELKNNLKGTHLEGLFDKQETLANQKLKEIEQSHKEAMVHEMRQNEQRKKDIARFNLFLEHIEDKIKEARNLFQPFFKIEIKRQIFNIEIKMFDSEDCNVIFYIKHDAWFDWLKGKSDVRPTQFYVETDDTDFSFCFDIDLDESVEDVAQNFFTLFTTHIFTAFIDLEHYVELSQKVVRQDSEVLRSMLTEFNKHYKAFWNTEGMFDEVPEDIAHEMGSIAHFHLKTHQHYPNYLHLNKKYRNYVLEQIYELLEDNWIDKEKDSVGNTTFGIGVYSVLKKVNLL